MGNTTSSSNYYKGSGSGASATSSLIFNSVGVVTLTGGGNGYASPPTVTFSGGGGSGASATATIDNGVVTSITVDNGGQGYASAPTVSFISVTAIDIRNIVTGSGVTKVGGYKDFPTLTSSTYAKMKPLLLNYSKNGDSSGDLMNSASAFTKLHNSPDSSVVVPTGAKAIRVISLGGGGGGGGNGGGMKGTANANNESDWANGGTGGPGGYGTYAYSKEDYPLNGATKIAIAVGNRGGAGTTGINGSTKNKSGATAPPGSPGAAGGASWINIGSVQSLFYGIGGNGGNGGKGAKGYGGYNKANAYTGVPGNSGSVDGKQGNQSSDWPKFDNTNVGTGGGAVGSGKSGQVRIIWLFGD